VQVLKKSLRKENWLLPSKKKKKSKNKIHRFGLCELLNQLLLSLGCWLMLARRFCVYNAGLKLKWLERYWLWLWHQMTKINVRSCKRHTVVPHVFCFWQSPCPFLTSRLTTVSLDYVITKFLLKCWTQTCSIDLSTNGKTYMDCYFDVSICQPASLLGPVLHVSGWLLLDRLPRMRSI